MNSARTTRRVFLTSSCSALVVAGAARSAGLAATFNEAIWGALVDQIAGPVELSSVLQVALTRDFEAKFGPSALRDLVGHFGRNGIITVLDPQVDPIEGQVQWIATYLFTGSVDPSDDGAPMSNYLYALAWKSLPFAKTPGLCSGPEFGYWLAPWSAT